LATTLGMTAVGAGLGAASGSLLGALADLGLSKEDAEVYAEGVKRGGVLVSVETDPEDKDAISDILRGAGAVDIDNRRQTWQDSGWVSFDEEAEKSDEDAYRR